MKRPDKAKKLFISGFSFLAAGVLGLLFTVGPRVSADYSGGMSDSDQTDQSDGYSGYADAGSSDDSASFYSGYYIYGYGDSGSDGYEQSDPAVVSLEAGDITSDSFSVRLLINSGSAVTSADISVLYDEETVALESDSVNEEIGGTAEVSKEEAGIYRYKYENPYSRITEEEYFTLEFSKSDSSSRSTVLYIEVNSLEDSGGALSYTADGTVVGFEISDSESKTDESLYSELKIDISAGKVSLTSLGIENVQSVELDNADIASADNETIAPLSEGITNMTVTYNDENTEYYRLVVYASQTSEEESQETAEPLSSEYSINEVQLEESDVGFSKRSAEIVIYIVVLLALAAIAAEYCMIVGNPYAKTARLLRIMRQRQKSGEDGRDFSDDDMFPEGYGIEDKDGGSEYETPDEE